MKKDGFQLLKGFFTIKNRIAGLKCEKRYGKRYKNRSERLKWNNVIV